MIVQQLDDALVVAGAEHSISMIMGAHPFRRLICSHCHPDIPQGFLVAMQPNTQLRTHFHPIDQFQVFVSGSGRIGRHDVGPGTVHYVDPSTPYGPLDAGDDGLAYLTLRPRSDEGAEWMPDSRDVLATQLQTVHAPSRRQLTAIFETHEPNNWSTPIDEADGLRVAMIELRPGANVTALPRGTQGGFLIVLDGVVQTADGASLGPSSIMHSDQTDPAPVLTASTPTRLIDVQFGRPVRVDSIGQEESVTKH